MKVRNGFVSNSSASSFVCGVCGGIEVGRDGEYDVETVCCTGCDETVHLECVTNFMDDAEKEDFAERDEQYEIDSKYCPLCQLKAISSDNILKYILKEKGMREKEVVDEIRSKVKSFKELRELLKK